MRIATSLVLLTTIAAAVQAHFVFVYVPHDAAEARLVFGHAAAPDPQTPATRAEKTTLTLRTNSGEEIRLKVEKGDGNFYRAAFNGHKPRLIYGITDAGVTQRGDNPPMLTWYYPKVIVGDPFTGEKAVVGSAVPLEVIPIKAEGGIRFQVLHGGKPLEGVEVNADLSDKAEKGEVNNQSVKTDANGLTPVYKEAGRYCVAARWTEAKSGEYGGKKYEAVRHVATLVCDVPSSSGR